jgi:4-amino-4-deoxy-L-arabinose transferase-like glycosyltransferase
LKFKLDNIPWSYAFLLIACAYVAGLFIDLTGDAGLYAAISRQMVESGDWFNLKINNVVYYEKPHLLFWLAGAGIKLFENTNFGFKIFPVLYGWLGFFFTYRLGRTLYSKEVGKLAALIIATSQIFFLYSLDIHTDSVLQTGVVLALWQLAEYLKFNKVKNFIFGFAGIGLAMLAKGPVGAVLPFFSVLFYLIVQKNFRQIFHFKWLAGIIIVLIIISPSLIYLYQNFGWLGIQFYFITNNIGRISGEYAGSSTDPFFYLYNMIWIFLPWTIFVFAAGYNEIKNWFSNRNRDPWGIYLLGSILAYLIIISIARGKAPNYFLMAVPPIVVVSAKWLVLWKKSYNRINRNLFRANYVFLSVFGLTFIGTLVIYGEDNILWFILALVLSSVILTYKSNPNLFQKTIYYSLIIIGIFNTLLNTIIIPELASFQGARQALEIFEENRDKDDNLYNWDLEEYELFYMADKKVENIDSWEKMYEIMDKHESWLYTNGTKHDEILDMGYAIDTVYTIQQRGLNELNFEFIYPKTRSKTLRDNYLIKVK